MAYRETTSKKVIARRVRRLRRAMRMSQTEFGREFGVTELTVRRWEHGKKAPTLRNQRTLYALEEREAGRWIEARIAAGELPDRAREDV